MLKKQIKARILLFAAGVCCLAMLTGCATSKQSAPEETENNTQISDDGSETTTDANTGGSETDLDTQNEIPETFKPSDLTIPSLEQYEEPYAGMNFTLPDSIKDQMESKEVAMLSHMQDMEQKEAVGYEMFTWNYMTNEQLEATVESKGNGYYEWEDSLERLGALGVYHTSYLEQLDQLTKCTDHKELGKSADGEYTYYLSIAKDADKDFAKALGEIELKITDMQPLTEDHGEAGDETLGEFSVQDLNGTSYTKEMFQDNKLTMVNVFTTWCTPCINEIPDLEKLHVQMKDQEVGVVGIILDAVDENGEIDEAAVEKAKLIQERTKATYPFLIPDVELISGRLRGIDAVPETFFVDKNGNIIGNTYSGSHSLDDWKKIVQTELDNFKGESE